MQPDPINPEEHRDEHPDQLAAMRQAEDRASERELADRAMDMRIVRALEQAPQVRISEDFAARVAARVPANTVRLRTARVQVGRVGFSVAAVCLIVLAIAMLAFAPRTTHNTFYLALEWTLAAQFCLIAAWIAMPRRS
jgi:hypothetical protein